MTYWQKLKRPPAALQALTGCGDDMCLACGGTGGHHEGCAGTTGLIALKTELAAARDDAEVHRIERRSMREMLAVERAAREKAEAEAARLRAALKNAPHDEHCTYRSPHTPADDCDCWKAAALAQEGT